MNTGSQKRPPQERERGQRQNAAAENPVKVATRHRQEIAEQVTQKIDPHAVHQADHDHAEGQHGVGQDTEQRVVGQAPLGLHQQHEQGERHRRGQDADGQVDAQQEAQRHAEQRTVRQRITEIGHAPPDHETAQRTSHERHAEPRDQAVEKERLQHHDAFLVE